MLGEADLARALETGTAPRASGTLTLHVLEIMGSILASGEHKGSVTLAGTASQPALLGEFEAQRLVRSSRDRF